MIRRRLPSQTEEQIRECKFSVHVASIAQPPIRVLPLEPKFTVHHESRALPLDALGQLERAARAMLEAVQLVKGGFLSPSQIPAPALALAAGSTVTDVANEFLLAKARAGRSDAYLSQCIKHLRSFIAGVGDVPLNAITAADVERWLYGQQWSQRTRLGHLLTVRTLFSFAVQRLYVVGNPALAVDKPQIEDEPPMIHTPDQVRHVLEANLAIDPSACRCLAVRYFGGLRTSEAVKLEEAEILHGRFIEVTAAKAKTRRRRLVTITPALAAWLLATQKHGGTLPLHQSNNRLAAAVARGAVPWGKSVTRHTFVSYHLAAFGSAAKTALEAGHTEQILFNHYRELVPPDVAREFWAMLPQSPSSGHGGRVTAA
jgi:integrase